MRSASVAELFNMYLIPHIQRLAYLKLDGYPPMSPLVFCPRCDFQFPPQSAGVPMCPRCDSPLHVTTVTPDLIEFVIAHAG